MTDRNQNRKQMAALPLPPGLPNRPLVGYTWQFVRDPLVFLTDLARAHGDVASFQLGQQLYVQVSHPDLIREVLVVQAKKFVKTGFLQRAEPILGNGLVTSEGEFHKRQRRLIQPAFSKERLAGYANTIVGITNKHAEQKWHDGHELDIFEDMLDMTLQIVAGTLFNLDITDEAEQIESSLTVVLEHFTRLISPYQRMFSKLPLPRNLRFDRARAQLDGIVYRAIERRRQSGEDLGDVMSMLLMAVDTEGDGSSMTDVQARDEVMTLLTAGHETVATALAWTWYVLACHPEILDQVQTELRNVLGRRPPRFEDLEQLQFTRQVFAETMRLYPPVWGITRRAMEDVEIGGYRIPEGSVVGMTQFVVHRDERFFENPTQCDPSRWDGEESSDRPRYAYFPFGGGPRLCIGESFAWMEALLVLGTLLQQWEPSFAQGSPPQFQPLITLRPKGGLRIGLTKRNGKCTESDEAKLVSR